jgi:hypothetical protein
MRARGWRRVARCIAWTLATAAAMPSVASAQSPADVEGARAFFVEATRLAKASRWREAREFYLRSLALKPSALTHYSLGVAQRETGRFADALHSFRAFLAEPSEPATAGFEEPARAAIAELEGRVGRLALTVEPRGLTGLGITIDGEPVPPTVEAAREIDAGPHEIVARASGFRDLIGHFTVGPRATVTMTLALSSNGTFAPSRLVIAGAVPPPDPVVAPRAGALTIVGPAPPPLQPVSPVPIALLASGAALFTAGLVVGLVGVKEAGDAPTQNGSDASAARTKATVGDVIASVGGVTAGIGLVLLLTQRRWSEAPKSAHAPLLSASRDRPWVVRF